MPLTYPYDLVAVGSQERGAIRNWETKTYYVHGIKSFHFDGEHVVGEISTQTAAYLLLPGEWFSFDCNDEQVIWYESEDEFRIGLIELGFEEMTVLLTVRENISQYWERH